MIKVSPMLIIEEKDEGEEVVGAEWQIKM
jgi:hypothetical protein